MPTIQIHALSTFFGKRKVCIFVLRLRMRLSQEHLSYVQTKSKRKKKVLIAMSPKVWCVCLQPGVARWVHSPCAIGQLLSLQPLPLPSASCLCQPDCFALSIPYCPSHQDDDRVVAMSLCRVNQFRALSPPMDERRCIQGEARGLVNALPT